eukprot:Selendium_serpulae@DN6270_c0_g2_i2.p1
MIGDRRDCRVQAMEVLVNKGYRRASPVFKGGNGVNALEAKVEVKQSDSLEVYKNRDSAQVEEGAATEKPDGNNSPSSVCWMAEPSATLNVWARLSLHRNVSKKSGRPSTNSSTDCLSPWMLGMYRHCSPLAALNVAERINHETTRCRFILIFHLDVPRFTLQQNN